MRLILYKVTFDTCNKKYLNAQLHELLLDGYFSQNKHVLRLILSTTNILIVENFPPRTKIVNKNKLLFVIIHTS